METREMLEKIREFGWHLTRQEATWCYPACNYYSLLLANEQDAKEVRDTLASMFTTVSFSIGEAVISNTIYKAITFYI